MHERLRCDELRVKKTRGGADLLQGEVRKGGEGTFTRGSRSSLSFHPDSGSETFHPGNIVLIAEISVRSRDLPSLEPGVSVFRFRFPK